MTRKLGTAINNNFDNAEMTINSRLAFGNNGDSDFYSGDLDKLTSLINPEIQLEGTDQVTGLDTALAGKQPLDATLTGLAALTATVGFLTQTSANNFTTRTFQDSSSIVCNNPDGVSGNPSFAVANSGVTPGAYGSASKVAPYTVGLDGRITVASETNIAISKTQITDPAALTKVDDTNVTLTLGGSPTTALLNATSITAGWNGTLSGTRGGTGVNNGANTITAGGNINFANAFSTVGAFASIYRHTAATDVTFPVSGTLATLSRNSRTVTADTTLTASDNGGIIYCNSTSPINITVPQQSTAALTAGFNCKIININTGDVRWAKEGFDIFYVGNLIVGQLDEANVFLQTVSGSVNTWVATGGTEIRLVSYAWDLETGSNASFIYLGIIPANTTLMQAYFKTNSGTITGQLTLNGVNITGAMSMSTTQNYASLTSPNVAQIGNTLGLTLSSNSAGLQIHVGVYGYERIYTS